MSTLEELLKEKATEHADDFPRVANDHNYYSQYVTFSNYMYHHVHPEVNAGAMIEDGGLLTDHGPEHIKTVIERAGYLLSRSNNKSNALSGYEIYILLCAIHMHDVGNLYGRKSHEKLSAEILNQVELLLGENTSEKKVIQRIAQAHGGNVEGDKDTISFLDEDTKMHSKPIRHRLLAAILRFADELADDISRASRFLNKQGLIPKEAQIYHEYASSLHSVSIDPNYKSIDLLFEIKSTNCIVKFEKDNLDKFLLDEVFERTDKTFMELIYCNRFMRPLVDLEVINIKIDINDPDNKYREPIYTINYRLEEKGYPSKDHKHISEICPELKNWKGNGRLTGKSLACLLENS